MKQLVNLKANLKELRFILRHKFFVLERKWHCHPLFARFYPQKMINVSNNLIEIWELKIATRRLLALLLCFTIITSAFLALYHPKSAKAAWWDDDFVYRQQITFTHNAALTDTSMRLTISNTNTLITAGKMQSDCDDSRFTDSTGKLLSYQLISGCNSTSTVYDVIFPTVLNGSNLAWFYYGNPSAITLRYSETPAGTTPSGSVTFAAEEKGPAPDLNYHFDEGYDATANSSGSCATCSANLQNMSSPATDFSGWTSDGKLNKALRFDGVNDYVYAATGSGRPSSSDFSISLWFSPSKSYSATADYLQGLIDQGSYRIFLDKSDGELKAEVNNGVAQPVERKITVRT